MKGSCILVASVLAASTVALTSSSTTAHPDHASNPSSINSCICSCFLSSSTSVQNDVASLQMSSSNKEKFAPRFDGLRFIETLVTAHR
ncbi:hypothetical protein Vadar_031863 [Vaccinium darrowii]|uniref:Uncharacterized protein n=1 Tax=Vaccinium darrowii TaxID=229202 RepID=A0ACB7XLR7_9ERIC|nr:hypothetical protein Vadar_031863 [Vaccinium darrowii]